MQVTTISEIITHDILNKHTGELEPTDFQKVSARKHIRGGYRRMYKKYDEALVSIVKSNTDLQTVIMIRDMFTYKQVEANISAAYLAKTVGVSRQKATNLLKAMVTNHMLMKVRTNVYRLNPFMYLPFRADAEVLQAEWETLLLDSVDSAGVPDDLVTPY
jgi:hypothetical protein